MAKKPELWGVKQFADALGITPALASQWLRRGKLPEPDYRLGEKTPIWLASKARRWIDRQEHKP